MAGQLPYLKIPFELQFVALRTKRKPTTKAAKASDGRTVVEQPVSLSKLGINPDGFLCNAMELHFRVKKPAAVKGRQFRARRIIQDELWIRDSSGNWKLQFRNTKWHEDHPILDPVCLQPPNLFSFDIPGWMVRSGHTKELQVPAAAGVRRERRTRPNELMMVWQMNFYSWFESLPPVPGRRWQRTSDKIRWHSRQTVYRDGSGKPWRSHTKTFFASTIGPGHLKLGIDLRKLFK